MEFISTIYLNAISSTLPLNQKIMTYTHVGCQARNPDYFGKEHLCVTHSTAVGKDFLMPIAPKAPRKCAINIEEPQVQLNSLETPVINFIISCILYIYYCWRHFVAH
jgi:hypothetical protein